MGLKSTRVSCYPHRSDTISFLSLFALLAACILLQLVGSTTAVPYGSNNNNLRFSPGTWRKNEGPLKTFPLEHQEEAEENEDEGNADRLVHQLAPIATQIDMLRALLEDEGGFGGGLLNPEEQAAEAEEMRRLALMEQRKRILEQQRLYHQRPLRAKRRGSCLFHAGLAHNCDYRDVVSAVNEASHWGSDMAPGKRKKRFIGN